jgi:hypothetical protein
MNLFRVLILSILVFPFHLIANIRMGIIAPKGFIGEKELAWRIKRTAEGLGWQVFLDEHDMNRLKNHKHLDFVLSLFMSKNIKKNSFNYLILSTCNFFEADVFRRISKGYDGFLLIDDPKKYELGQEFPYIIFYPTVEETPYLRVALNDLVTLLPAFGNRRDDPKFRNLYSLLDQSGFTSLYGMRFKDLSFLTRGYKGQIPFDGQSIIPIYQEHGIVLVLHSDDHLQQKIPSGRIFEAAAASAVIISDKNAFVEKHFGDSVFYVDTSLSEQEIFSQIQHHMDFIRLHPETALGMAEKAHEIFNEYFGLAKLLLNLKNMHEQIKAEQKYSKASNTIREK